MQKPTIFRTPDEIQRAHDLLLAYYRNEIQGAKLPKRDRAQYEGILHGLCWVLGHRHNATLEFLLEGLRLRAEDSGAAEPLDLTFPEGRPN